MSDLPITFVPLPIQIACPVPVAPDGPREDATSPECTERCAVWAHWMIGAQVACDCHVLMFCEIAGIDFDELVKEAGRDPLRARAPWAERGRSTQEDATLTNTISERGTAAS